MTYEEIENRINNLTFHELKSIVDASFEPMIAEDHIVRKIVKECVSETVFVHVGIIALLPCVSKRLITELEGQLNNNKH